MLNVISLFTGTGMLDRSVRAALQHFGIEARTICYIEQSKAAQEVVRAEMAVTGPSINTGCDVKWKSNESGAMCSK